TLASDTFFQAYLVDGLARWNEDWSLAAAGREQPYSCSGLQRYAANQLAQEWHAGRVYIIPAMIRPLNIKNLGTKMWALTERSEKDEKIKEGDVVDVVYEDESSSAVILKLNGNYSSSA
ncbi:hypothetical protein P4O66_019692, partial [Electrophorus voltai]